MQFNLAFSFQDKISFKNLLPLAQHFSKITLAVLCNTGCCSWEHMWGIKRAAVVVSAKKKKPRIWICRSPWVINSYITTGRREVLLKCFGHDWVIRIFLLYCICCCCLVNWKMPLIYSMPSAGKPICRNNKWGGSNKQQGLICITCSALSLGMKYSLFFFGTFKKGIWDQFTNNNNRQS